MVGTTGVTPVARVAVVGLGYVGLPLSVQLALAGLDVVGFDTDHDHVRRLAAGDSPIPDVPSEQLAQVAGHLAVTTHADDLRGCDTFIICVPTPLTPTGQPDTGHIRRAVELIAPYVTSGALVVLESTSYPGTTEELVASPLGAATGLAVGTDFCVAFSPERVDPGNAEFGLANTPKVVAGLLPCCRDRAAALYASVTSSVVPAKGLREAELSKLLENTYRQVNIALMNEMAKFCHALGIDLRDAVRCASTKPFGFQPFYPGPGVGGHCIPIDPKFLASRVQSELGYAFRFVELAQEINDGMPEYVVQRVGAELRARGRDLGGSRVLLLGVTYKRNIPDTRESPAQDVARALRREGAAIAYWDPFVPDWSVDGEGVPPLVSSDAPYDAAILVQDHEALGGLDLAALADFCFDTRGQARGAHVIQL